MNTRSGILLAAALIAACASPAQAAGRFGPEAGYLSSSKAWYGSGLLYGASILEGTGRFGMGLVLMRTNNSETSGIATKSGVLRHTDDLSDFYVSVLGTLMRSAADRKTTLVAGAGPQVHFLTAARQHIDESYTESARESRLGIAFMGRYERVIEAFGKTAFTVSVTCSWMEGGVETVADPYPIFAPPGGSVTSAAVTVGLSFPF